MSDLASLLLGMHEAADSSLKRERPEMNMSEELEYLLNSAKRVKMEQDESTPSTTTGDAPWESLKIPGLVPGSPQGVPAEVSPTYHAANEGGESPVAHLANIQVSPSDPGYHRYKTAQDNLIHVLKHELPKMEICGDDGCGGLKHSAEIQIHQQMVGKVIGKGGEAIQRLCEETGCEAAMDQTTKEKGFSLMKIAGTVDEIHRLVFAVSGTLKRLLKRDSIVAQGKYDEVNIHQLYVAKVIGKSGENIERIKKVSGADVYIQVDQYTKQEYSTARIIGTDQERDECKRQLHHLLDEIKIAETRGGDFSLAPKESPAGNGVLIQWEVGAKSLGGKGKDYSSYYGKGYGMSKGYSSFKGVENLTEDSFAIPGIYVGSLIGKSGCVIKSAREWAQNKGGKIFVEQNPSEIGKGLVKVVGSPEVVHKLKSWVEYNISKLKSDNTAHVLDIHSMFPFEVSKGKSFDYESGSYKGSKKGKYGSWGKESGKKGWGKGKNDWNSDWNSSSDWSSSSSGLLELAAQWVNPASTASTDDWGAWVKDMLNKVDSGSRDWNTTMGASSTAWSGDSASNTWKTSSSTSNTWNASSATDSSSGESTEAWMKGLLGW